MTKKIPIPSIERLCAIYQAVEQMETGGAITVSSQDLGQQLGVNANSIRKDISFLGEIGNCRAGYSIRKLKDIITEKLKLNRKKMACIIGLGRLGTAILKYERLLTSGFELKAGFDSNINKIETIQTKVPLYPASEIATIVKQEKIEIGVLAVPANAAAESAKRLMDGGIRGIVNFSPIVIKSKPGVSIRNIDLVGEMRIVSVLSMVNEENLN